MGLFAPDEGGNRAVIHIRYANRLESLAGMLAERIATDPVGVLEPEVLVVQGPATARWQTLWFAEYMGICANVRFPLPGGHLGRVSGQSSGTA